MVKIFIYLFFYASLLDFWHRRNSFGIRSIGPHVQPAAAAFAKLVNDFSFLSTIVMSRYFDLVFLRRRPLIFTAWGILSRI